MGFQNNLAYIRIHKDNFTHNNRKIFFKEFKYWEKRQNYKNIYFKNNKSKILERLNYLKLIYLLLNKKNAKLITEIMRYPFGYLKIKLLIIYFLPQFLVRFKIKYL